MPGKDRFIIEARPETDVYATGSGFIAIRQKLRNEETVVLLSVEETEKVIVFLQQCVAKLKMK